MRKLPLEQFSGSAAGLADWIGVPLAGLGITSGLAAAGCIVAHFNLAALFLFLLSRCGLATTRDGSTIIGAAVAILDRIALAAVPFAFALSAPEHALAACFMIVGFIAAFAGPSAEGDGLAARVQGFYGVIVSLALATACIIPDWFGLIAYGSGVLGFVAAGLEVSEAGGAR